MRFLVSLAVLCVLSSTAWAVPSLPPASDWAVYENQRFGYRLAYPGTWFQTGPVSANGDGRAFTSRDGAARVVVFGAHNSEGLSLRDYRETLLSDYGDYGDLTYSPVGNTWFVLSGYQGDRIYYQKVMFSCGGRIINALSISFPESEKPAYSPIIEGIEDRFRTGQGEDTPADCG